MLKEDGAASKTRFGDAVGTAAVAHLLKLNVVAEEADGRIVLRDDHDPQAVKDASTPPPPPPPPIEPLPQMSYLAEEQTLRHAVLACSWPAVDACLEAGARATAVPLSAAMKLLNQTVIKRNKRVPPLPGGGNWELRLFERFIQAGASLGPDENDEVALNTAIRLKRADFIKVILASEQTADSLNAQDVEFNTPMHVVILTEQFELIEHLRSAAAAKKDQGVEPLHCRLKNQDQLTSIDLAARSSRPGTKEVLEKLHRERTVWKKKQEEREKKRAKKLARQKELAERGEVEDVGADEDAAAEEERKREAEEEKEEEKRKAKEELEQQQRDPNVREGTSPEAPRPSHTPFSLSLLSLSPHPPPPPPPPPPPSRCQVLIRKRISELVDSYVLAPEQPKRVQELLFAKSASGCSVSGCQNETKVEPGPSFWSQPSPEPQPEPTTHNTPILHTRTKTTVDEDKKCSRITLSVSSSRRARWGSLQETGGCL